MHALRDQAESGGDTGYTVSLIMCPDDGQQKNDKKARRPQPRRGQRQGRKKQEQTATRWWVFAESEFICAWCFEVIWCV